MYVKCYGSAICGIGAITVAVEVNISAGIGMYLVGLPDNAVKESQERIRSAFENCGYKMSGKKVVVNLAPADIRKEGSAYDLPIAISILAASGQVDSGNLEKYIIMGELSLDGSLLPIKGALPIAIEAEKQGFQCFILPKNNASEAAVVEGITVYGADSLKDVVEILAGESSVVPTKVDLEDEFSRLAEKFDYDFADVKGQGSAKRALEVAAAGGHNILMIGAPGSGKTMLARRMPSIMPPFTVAEALETTKIHSVAGKLGSSQGLITERPFRSPHHLASQVALVGGGASPQPGEISLAHNGILFLDELPEFGRSMLEVMRQPLEDKQVCVSRSKYSVVYPANFMLIASMNPCPCGYYNHPTKECVCTKGSVFRYMNRISGPMMDRIDMHIEVTPVPFAELTQKARQESSRDIRERVMRARKVQSQRFAGTSTHTNSLMTSGQIQQFCALTPQCMSLLQRAMEKLSLSARAYDRIIKVARTIADIEGVESINTSHIAEAIQYRSLDRDTWGA